MGLLFYPKKRKAQSNSRCSCRSILSLWDLSCILVAGFLLMPNRDLAGQESLLDKTISIPRQNVTLYNALNLISQKADVLFIYDSQVVENEKHVKISAENQSVRQILDNILSNPAISYKVIGQHILIYKISQQTEKIQPSQLPLQSPHKDSLKSIIIKGHVFDHENNAALPFVTIGILEENIGTITNADGYFTLKVPAAFSGTSLVISHIGYMSQRIPIQLIDEQKVDIFLERRIISIQEVIIRYIDPNDLVQKAMEKREKNNNLSPVYITSFYREGVQKNKRYLSYSESVFKIYKSSFWHNEHSDQVKLLKSRKVQNSNTADTVFVKLKAGVLSALQLDIVKCVPGFLDLTPPFEYNFTFSDVVSYNSKDAYVITFIQKEGITDALFTGALYIDKESYAILGADFEINPAYIDKATQDLVLKKSRKLIVKLEKINYSISYTPFNGTYYLNHARCDIRLKTRMRHHLASDDFTTYFELAACGIDTLNVVKFPRQEVLKPNVVFLDAPFNSDEAFWGDYNIISPEAKLSEALSKIIGKIEKME
jgi:hypothetical protein